MCGDSFSTKTNNQGEFFEKYIASLPGTNTITVFYAGNNKYKSTTAKRTFNVTGQATTYIKLNNIKDTTLENTVTINGYYHYGNNKPLTFTTMRLNINGQIYAAKTDKQGHFTYNYKTNNIGTNRVTAYYPGNTKFKKATTTKTFNVKVTSPLPTYITLNDIKDVTYNEYTTISGHYYYENNKPLTFTTMRLNINGEIIAAKTDKQGYFTYKYKTERIEKKYRDLILPEMPTSKQQQQPKHST